MKNKEKFAKEILDIACNGSSIAVDENGKVVACENLPCIKCIFYGGPCSDKVRKWAESEVPRIQAEVKNCKVDDKILVSCDGKNWIKGHFAEYDNVHDKVLVYKDGGTSWSTDIPCYWGYAKLPESE